MKTNLSGNKWLALLSVTLAYSFAFLTRYIWSPIMSDVGAEFQISSTQMGIYMTAFMIGYLIMQIPGGILADRLRPKYLLMTCVGIATAGSAVFSGISSYGIGLLVRGLEGLSLGGIYSSCSKIVSGYFTQKDRAVAMGILLASPSLGILLANSLGEPLNELLGWRLTVRIVAYIGIAVFLLLFLFVRPGEKETGGAQKVYLGLTAGVPEVTQVLETLLYFADKQQVLLALSGMLSMFASVGFATWMNTYMKTELGYSGLQGGVLLTVYSIVGIAAACISGPVVKWFNWDPRRFLIVLMALGAVCMAGFGMVQSYAALMALGIGYGIVVNLPSAHLANFCIQRAPKRYIATMCALENLIMQLGAMIQSYVIGAAADSSGSYHVMWTAFAVAYVLSVAAMCLFNPNGGRTE